MYLLDRASIRDVPAAGSVSLMMPVLARLESDYGNTGDLPDQAAVPCQVPKDRHPAVEFFNLPFEKHMLL